MEKTMDKIVALAKARALYSGFGDLRRTCKLMDYGNLGVELKNNIKKAWWKNLSGEPYNVDLDLRSDESSDNGLIRASRKLF